MLERPGRDPRFGLSVGDDENKRFTTSTPGQTRFLSPFLPLPELQDVAAVVASGPALPHRLRRPDLSAVLCRGRAAQGGGPAGLDRHFFRRKSFGRFNDFFLLGDSFRFEMLLGVSSQLLSDCRQPSAVDRRIVGGF